MDPRAIVNQCFSTDEEQEVFTSLLKEWSTDQNTNLETGVKHSSLIPKFYFQEENLSRLDRPDLLKLRMV